jgi:hypothetical protein
MYIIGNSRALLQGNPCSYCYAASKIVKIMRLTQTLSRMKQGKYGPFEE